MTKILVFNAAGEQVGELLKDFSQQKALDSLYKDGVARGEIHEDWDTEGPQKFRFKNGRSQVYDEAIGKYSCGHGGEVYGYCCGLSLCTSSVAKHQRGVHVD